MTTLLDDICGVVADLDMSQAQAADLVRRMKDYRTTYHETYRSLQRIPGAKKMWNAIYEAAYKSLHEGKKTIHARVGTPFGCASKELKTFVIDNLEMEDKGDLIELIVERLSDADMQEYAEVMKEYAEE